MLRNARGRAWAGWGLVLLLVGVTASVLPAGAQDTATIERGEALFQMHCARCHGGVGQGGEVPGGGGEAPPLAGRDDVTAAYVDLTLRTGRMPPVGDPFDNRARAVTIEGEDSDALLAYMTERLGLEDDIPEPVEGDPAEGLSVYAANCAHCHGSSGEGGVAGAGAYTPPLTQHDAVTIVEAIRVGPFEMPAFSPDQISDEEAAGVAAFLEVVGNDPGTPLLGLVELNPVYAGAFVALLSALLLFSLFYIAGRATWFPDARPAPGSATAERTLDAEEPFAAPQPPPQGEPPPGTGPHDPAAGNPPEGSVAPDQAEEGQPDGG